MRLPDPIANTTTEAYLAYKAGVLAVGDLKPKLYEPYIHLDAWLAYWTGLVPVYPVTNVGKNILSVGWEDGMYDGQTGEKASASGYRTIKPILVEPDTKYIVTRGGSGVNINIGLYDKDGEFIQSKYVSADHYFTTTGQTKYAVFWRGTTGGIDEMMVEKGEEVSQYEPYTGEPEMLTDEEAYIAYLSGVTDTYPEEFRDPADIRVAAYLRYLISGRWGRPEYPVNNEEFYLSLMKTKYIPSGDPSSDIVIDGTAKAPFVDVKMYGDTEQQSYTGKNLLGASLATMQSENTGGTWSNGTYTRYGVTVTPVFSNGLLQRIELSGTATSNFTFIVAKSYSKSEFEAIVTAGETYTLSGCPSGGSPTTYYLRVLENPYKNLYTDVGEGLTKQMPSISSGATSVRLLIGVDSGTDTTGLVFRPQFEKSATATSYEPYVGGVPAPNPDYPQAVNTVTGRQVVKVKGKNLFNQTDTRQRGYINDTGGITDSNLSVAYTEYYPVEPEHTYIISYNVVATGSSVRYIGFYDSSFNYLSRAETSGVSSYTFSTPANTRYLRVSFRNSNGMEAATFLTDYINNIQIEAGSTATDYEPYSSNDYEINLGKNLFDKSNMNIRNAYLYNNTFVLRSTYADRTFILPCLPNTTYTISRSVKTATFRAAYSELAPSAIPEETSTVNTLTCAGTITNNNASSITITTGSTAKSLLVHYGTTTNDGQTLIDQSLDTMMVEYGPQATTYAPYFTPIELCKLDTYQDYIWKDSEEWKLHQEITQKVFNGSEQWSKSNATLNNVYIQVDTSVKKDTVVKSDKLTEYAASYMQVNSVVGIAYNTTGAGEASIRISCGIDGAADVPTFRGWLNGVAPKAYYAKATPTDTVITNQALIDQLEALAAGGAENGTTYIKVDATDPNLPGLLYVEAPKYD